MALLAQFIGSEAVAQMSSEEIERSCEILHAEMLKQALQNEGTRRELAKSTEAFAANMARFRAGPQAS